MSMCLGNIIMNISMFKIIYEIIRIFSVYHASF